MAQSKKTTKAVETVVQTSKKEFPEILNELELIYEDVEKAHRITRVPNVNAILARALERIKYCKEAIQK